MRVSVNLSVFTIIRKKNSPLYLLDFCNINDHQVGEGDNRGHVWKIGHSLPDSLDRYCLVK